MVKERTLVIHFIKKTALKYSQYLYQESGLLTFKLIYISYMWTAIFPHFIFERVLFRVPIYLILYRDFC